MCLVVKEIRAANRTSNTSTMLLELWLEIYLFFMKRKYEYHHLQDRLPYVPATVGFPSYSCETSGFWAVSNRAA
jgi:hypothetical protein